MKQKQHAAYTQLINFSLELALFVLCYLVLYIPYTKWNVGLQQLSRTAITVTLGFFLSLIVFTGVYGSFRIGIKRKRQLFSSQICKVLFTDLVTFMILQIMNTNPNNPEANAHFVLFDKNLLITFVAFLVQILVIFLLLEAGFRIYYKINPPSRCLVIADTPRGANHITVRMNAYPRDLSVTEAISPECPDWRQTILDNDVVAMHIADSAKKNDIIRFCYDRDILLYVCAGAEDIALYTAEDSTFLDTLFLAVSGKKPTVIQSFIKRLFDIVFSALLLILLSPLLLVIVIVLAFSGNGSVIFRQERRTRGGRIFRIMKFRTMYVHAETNISMKKNDSRITPFGKFLRRYRLDELPQLLNIIKGDMSIVGPRPEMLGNVEQYVKEAPEFSYREKMRAGITGLAQLEGAYDTSPRDKAMLDMLYIEKFSLGLDLKLILRTFTVFFRKENEGFSQKESNRIKLRTTARKDVHNG